MSEGNLTQQDYAAIREQQLKQCDSISPRDLKHFDVQQTCVADGAGTENTNMLKQIADLTSGKLTKNFADQSSDIASLALDNPEPQLNLNSEYNA